MKSRLPSPCVALIVLILLGGAARADSPADRLSAAKIDAEQRKAFALDGLVAVTRGHDRAVAALAFAPDGTLLASSGWDNTVRLWKLGGPELLEGATLAGSPSGVAFDLKGKLLAAGGKDTRVYLWDVSAAKPKLKHALSGHSSRPFAVAFSPKGKLFGSGAFGPVLRLWKYEEDEPEQWAALANEEASSRGLSSLAFSHEGQYVVAGSHLGRQTLRVWDAAGRYLEERDVPEVKARLVACSPVGPVLALSGNEAKVRLWGYEGKRFRELRVLAGHTGRGLGPIVKALAFAPDGKTLASAGQDRKVILWDAGKGTQRQAWQFLDEVRALAFAPDGRHLAVGNANGTLYVLRLAN